ncbi:MAG: hypothetical protein KIS91_08975 [Anaerolineae bacterium]|nr:hypothetical protein [Anaerolineae bacterium]
MSVVETLYRLQQRDLRLDALRRRKRDIEAAVIEPASVLNSRATAASTLRQVEALQSNLRDADFERQSLNTKIASEEQRLYGGKVSNVKEMTSIESEIQSLRRRLSTLDDRMIETMIALETAQAEQRSAADKLAAIEQRWATHLAGLQQQQRAVEVELGEVETAIADLRATLPSDVLADYDDLRRKKGGRAVAAINRGRCEGCQVALPIANIDRARLGEIALCNNCGRILVAGV